MHDMHNNIKAIRTIAPIAVGTTGTGQAGKPIDRRGYGSVEFLNGYGAVTATNAVFTFTMKEGDVTSAMTSVADADLLGTELGGGVGATASRVSGVSKNVVKRVGYRGTKRYVSGSIKSTVTAAALISSTVLLGNAELRPVAT